MFRVAAIGDLHIWGPIPEFLPAELDGLHERADVLVIAGDITNNGLITQAERAAELLVRARVPIVAVFGNHDRRTIRRRRYVETLERAGVIFLEGTTLTLGDRITVGFAGVGGSGGGFWPDEGPDTISRRTSQLLAVKSRREAARLDRALSELNTDYRVVVTHVAPTLTTCAGEPSFKFFLLGNSELARVIDRQQVDLVLHGHSHRGFPTGITPGGTPVRNVAKNVVREMVYLTIGDLPPARAWRPAEATA